MGRLKKNLGLQTIYQLLVTLVPLITSPYLSRTLGATGLGVYSYTYSIVNYFMLFSMLGITNYGSRSIAMARDEGEENQLFCEIYSLQIVTTLLSSVVFGIFFVLFDTDSSYALLIQSLWIFSCFFDVSWYFFGREEFKITVTRNIVIKIITVISIFLFVHNENDLWKYVLIMAGGTVLSQFALFLCLKGRVTYNFPGFKNLSRHIKPNIILFVPIIAMSVYHMMDKTMLGLLCEYSESGYYYNADKVINIPLAIITGVGTVMLPKMASLRSTGNIDEGRKILGLSIECFTCLAIAMSFGIAAVAKEFVPVFFGDGYDACVDILNVLSYVMIFKTVSNVTRTQYLIPYNKEKIYIYAVLVGACINFVCNYTLIGILGMGAIGATIGTIIAEFIVCIIQVIAIEREVHLIKDLLKTIPYIIIGALMYLIVRQIGNLEFNIFVKLISEILVGGVFFVIVTLLYWVLSKNQIINLVFANISLFKRTKKTMEDNNDT